MIKIALDAGHGIDTSGKRSFDESFFEYEFNRDIVQRMVELFSNYKNIEIVLTSPTTEDVSLSQRCKIANNANADIFVSIHANAFGSSWNTANGWEIYVYSKSGEQLKLAEDIHSESIPYLELTDRGIKANDTFYVLAKTNMPAVLIEHGFYTNLEELALLKDDNFRQKSAIANVKGVLKYFNIQWIEPKVEEIPEIKEEVENKIEVTKTNILINNKEYEVNRILFEDKNYIELREFEKACFTIDYNEEKNIPIINTPDFKEEKVINRYLYGKYDVVEVNPEILEVKRSFGSLNDISCDNVINAGFIELENNTPIPKSILVSNGEYLKATEEIVANTTTYNKSSGTFILYNDGIVDIKKVHKFDDVELSNIKTAISGFSLLPELELENEGFDAPENIPLNFDDVSRNCNRIALGYNPTKNKIIFLAGMKLNAKTSQTIMAKLGCTKAIGLNVGGYAHCKIENKEIVTSDNKRQFAFITF